MPKHHRDKSPKAKQQGDQKQRSKTRKKKSNSASTTLNPKDVSTETIKIFKQAYKYQTLDNVTVSLDRKRVQQAERSGVVHNPCPSLKDFKQQPSSSSSSTGHIRITVFQGECCDSAVWLSYKQQARSILLLDFASDTNPGGGWRGNQQVQTQTRIHTHTHTLI